MFEIRMQSPIHTFEERFQEYRCCNDSDLKREIFIASIPYVVIAMLSLLYVIGGAMIFAHIDDALAKNDHVNSSFFIFTTLTTVGYGNVVPGNFQSKIFCMFYVGVGVPLLLLALADFGHLFAELYWTLTLSIFGNLQVAPESRRKVPVLVVTLFLFLHTLIGGILFTYCIDEQPFLTAIYFSFVSITTIGFGDVVVTPRSDIDNTVLIIYLIFGIIIMTMFVNSMVHYAEWLHYLGRERKAFRKTTIWFGADSMTVEQLVQLVAKNFNVSPVHLKRTLRDLEHVIALALQDDLRKRSKIVIKHSICCLNNNSMSGCIEAKSIFKTMPGFRRSSANSHENLGHFAAADVIRNLQTEPFKTYLETKRGELARELTGRKNS